VDLRSLARHNCGEDAHVGSDIDYQIALADDVADDLQRLRLPASGGGLTPRPGVLPGYSYRAAIIDADQFW
jgi:hypothetical protein